MKMDSAFRKGARDESPKARKDDDLRVPFTATELRHSLSEGAAAKPTKNHDTSNGYRRMHSFHSTLPDNHWDFEDGSSLGSFLSSDFRETLLDGFPELKKNGFQGHSFDNDIFDETAERFSSGFFSESEIDDIPRSTLFQKTGLRRSISNVGPRTKATKARNGEAHDDDNKMQSRQSKIEELIRLKKKLEELKQNWRGHEAAENQNTEAYEEGHSESEKTEESMDSHMDKTKEKAVQKRRRLSSLKQSQSLSSKLEELVEEDERDSNRDDPNSSEENKDRLERSSPTSRINGYASPSRIRRGLFDDVVRIGAGSPAHDRTPKEDDPKEAFFNRNEDNSVRRKVFNRSFDEETTRSEEGFTKRDLQRSVSTSFDTTNSRGKYDDRSQRNDARCGDRFEKKCGKYSSFDHEMQAADSRRRDKEETYLHRSNDGSNSQGSSYRRGSNREAYDSENTQEQHKSNDRFSSSDNHNFKKSLEDEMNTKTGDTFRRLRSRDEFSDEAFENPGSPFRNDVDERYTDSGSKPPRFGHESNDGSSRHDRLNRGSLLSRLAFPRGKFFEDDFFARDWKRHQLVEEIGDIQRHLADITKRELGKRRATRLTTGGSDRDGGHTRPPLELKRSTSEIDLQTQRTNLTSALKDLLCKKQEREQQIRERMDKLKGEQEPTHCAPADDGGAKESEGEVSTTDISTTIEPTDEEDDVTFILRRAGAEEYIPIVRKNGITVDRLYQFLPSDFADLDITDPELQQRLQEEIDRHYVAQKNAQLEAAEMENPACVKGSKCTEDRCGKTTDEPTSLRSEESAPASLISSAPEGYEPEVPVHVSAECVVCLDEQSNLLFLNCGHVCCCYDCSINLVLCPLCRAEIEAKLIMNENLSC